MVKILPCPICGSMDVICERESGDCRIEYWTEYECFDRGECYDNGPTFRTAESWNKYAAAMNLAKAIIKCDKVFKSVDEKGYDEASEQFENAEMKVLEVFNG